MVWKSFFELRTYGRFNCLMISCSNLHDFPFVKLDMEAESVYIQKHLVGIEYLPFNSCILLGGTLHGSWIYMDKNTCFTFRSNWKTAVVGIISTMLCDVWIQHNITPFPHFAQKHGLSRLTDQNLKTPWTMFPLFQNSVMLHRSKVSDYNTKTQSGGPWRSTWECQLLQGSL
jgi:hypothetical protein